MIPLQIIEGQIEQFKLIKSGFMDIFEVSSYLEKKVWKI